MMPAVLALSVALSLLRDRLERLPSLFVFGQVMAGFIIFLNVVACPGPARINEPQHVETKP
ncbi:MAG: hypothetical protein R2751_17465 [Bacteroidales bacterium]